MKKVLMIDDDQELIEVIDFILKKEKDIQFFSAQEAYTGLDMAKGIKPDLILMDVMMPGLNGGEAMKLMKKQPELKDVSVIFFTGLLSRDDSSNGLTILVDGNRYAAIPKPFEVKQLLTKIKNKLGMQDYEKHFNYL